LSGKAHKYWISSKIDSIKPDSSVTKYIFTKYKLFINYDDSLKTPGSNGRFIYLLSREGVANVYLG